MENEFQRPLSGKALQSFLSSLSQALKDTGVNVKSENATEQTGAQDIADGLKAHFCVGINSVTRTLERMPHKSKKGNSIAEKLAKSVEAREEVLSGPGKSKPVTLQAIVVAVDVYPKKLVSHLGHLSKTRGVPMVSISGGDGMGSLRLGEVLGLRTATAVGVKTGKSPIATAVQAVVKK